MYLWLKIPTPINKMHKVLKLYTYNEYWLNKNKYFSFIQKVIREINFQNIIIQKVICEINFQNIIYLLRYQI